MCFKILSADLRATAKGLRRGPYSLGTVVTEGVEPVLEGLDARLDIVNEAMAVVTAAVTKVGGTFGMPDGRIGGIDANGVCVLEYDICTLHVWSKVVVLRSEVVESSINGIMGQFTWQLSTIETGW